MNQRDQFLNDTSAVSIYTGGAGKGGSYTGLLKFKPFVEGGKQCAVVMRNKKDMVVGGGVFDLAKSLFDYEKYQINPAELLFKNGASIKFLTANELRGKKFDALFVDNASQVDESYNINDFLIAPKVWFNTNSNKCRGFLFELIKDYLVDCGDHYEFNKFADVHHSSMMVYHGTFLDNLELLLVNPTYPRTLSSLPSEDRGKLLYGYFYK